MKKRIYRIISLIMIVSISVCCFSVVSSAAQTQSQLINEINRLEQESKKLESQIKTLEGQKADQQTLKSAIEKKIANTQQQINLCNAEISKINSAIAQNKAEINKKNEEIEQQKLAFKKRLRTIQMSNTGSNVQVLLGADSFSEFLQLSQLTAAVSAHDKRMIDDLVEEIAVIEEKQKENERMLNEQVSIKSTIAAKQAELERENARISGVINSISSEQKDLKSENADIEKQIREFNATLRSMQNYTGNSGIVYDGGNFRWPSNFTIITAGYASDDSVHKGTHYGVDISGSGIAGTPVYAMADGVVYRHFGTCTHNCKKERSCGCGGGYGNYVAIDHGNSSNGTNYKAYYAHMASITVTTGTYVKKGQVIGYVGTTGWSTGYHLHFGIMVNNSWVDPMKFFRKVQ